MKKIILCLCMAAVLAIGAFAAETVIYENDFSDPATIADFKQYCQEWEIKDGGLYLTEEFFSEAVVKNINSSFAHIIYQPKEKLTDYIVEVDYMNVQTAGGIIFRADESKVDHQVAGFYGYLAFIANDANKGAFGCCDNGGVYKGNIDVGKAQNCNISSNVHIKVTVKGEKVHVLMTNLESGKTVYEFSYTIGTSKYDQIWASGTAGLRMRAGMEKNDAYSAGVAYFDNFKITTADEVDLGSTGVIPGAPTTNLGELKIDTSNLVAVYENGFDTFTALSDFEQFRGTWEVNNGRLYLSGSNSVQSYILYAGKEELTTLADYVVDVDMYNVQTQGGIIIRSDFANVTGDTDDGFMGYQAFMSNTGKQGALGAGKPDGKWLEGNIEVSPVISAPGANLHLQFAVKGNILQYVITDIDSGKVLWQWSEEHDMWEKGTFGFRLRGNESNGMSNVGTVSFDNLVVSVYGEPTVVEPEKTEVVLTVGNTTAYINGEAQTLDAAPINRNNRVMLPVRFLANAFGVPSDGIKWDGNTRTATLISEDVTISITIDAAEMIVNGEKVALDSPAIIENDRTYLPVRAIANALGVSNDNIEWDGATSTATLTK